MYFFCEIYFFFNKINKKMSLLIHILDAFAKEMRLPLIWIKFTLVKMHEYYGDKFYQSIFY